MNKKNVENTFKKGRINIESKYLVKGRNEISMNILNKYRNDGYGMHSFKDQVDKS